MDISFRGARYHGWQVQPGDVSVQGTLEAALATLARRPVAVIGAGRTDAGVNARRMVAHADLDLAPDRTPRLIRSLNAILRPDIVVNAMTPVADDAHARFDAVSRTYRYFAHTVHDPFVYPLSWLTPPKMDFSAMNEAARHILGTQDFTSFAKLHSDARTNICTVTHACWHRIPQQPSQWFFEITADRFLRNMVRAVVGTLTMVGTGRIPPDAVRDIIASRNRCAAGTSMPANALFLWDVNYPYYNPPT